MAVLEKLLICFSELAAHPSKDAAPANSSLGTTRPYCSDNLPMKLGELLPVIAAAASGQMLTERDLPVSSRTLGADADDGAEDHPPVQPEEPGPVLIKVMPVNQP